MIPFNKPFITGQELSPIGEAIANGHLSGDGAFTKRCEAWLTARFCAAAVALTHSGTAALEMAALLADIGPGDEVIMPSFTFVTTATAFVLRGAVPVFVDIDESTLNLDPVSVASAISSRTRAVVPVHYGGVGCDMDALTALTAEHGLALIEDAAHCLGATYKDRELGTFGAMAALSFHETKNIICGEGGALILNDPALVARAEFIRQKGTNRRQFQEGLVDKYTWVDLGSSFLPSDLTAAFLAAQLERADEIIQRRIAIWDAYHVRLEPLEERFGIRRPIVPAESRHNGHLYYVLLPPGSNRAAILHKMKARGVMAIFHYVPLHSSPAGVRFGRCGASMRKTEDLAARLVRLPLWVGMDERLVDETVDALQAALS